MDVSKEGVIMLNTLPKTINMKTDEALEAKLKGLSKGFCFDFMGKYLAYKTNELLKDPKYKGGQVLVRICSASEVANIKAKDVDELGSVVDYGEDDPTRGFQGSKMYFFNLNKSIEEGKASGDFVDALKDRYTRINQIHNARAQAGLENYEEFDNPSFAIVVLPKDVSVQYADKIARGSSAYNNKSGGSMVLDEIVFSPEVLKHCGVATCNDLYTELQSKMLDNPYFYQTILEEGSDLLKNLVLNMLNQIEAENAAKTIPQQARENLKYLGDCTKDKGDFMTCLIWYCSSEKYKGLTAEGFLDLVCSTYGNEISALKISDQELADVRDVARLNDSNSSGSAGMVSEDALDYAEEYPGDDDYESGDDDWGSDGY
jgi:hypothetical protein